MRNEQINVLFAESRFGKNALCSRAHNPDRKFEDLTAVHIEEMLLIFNGLMGGWQT
ncbi:hypothetical protein D3C75_1140020 [compost metagenome]